MVLARCSDSWPIVESYIYPPAGDADAVLAMARAREHPQLPSDHIQNERRLLVETYKLAPSTSGVGGLRKAVTSPVWLPGSEGYDRAVSTWNAGVQLGPAVVLGARTAADVAAAVPALDRQPHRAHVLIHRPAAPAARPGPSPGAAREVRRPCPDGTRRRPRRAHGRSAGQPARPGRGPPSWRGHRTAAGLFAAVHLRRRRHRRDPVARRPPATARSSRRPAPPPAPAGSRGPTLRSRGCGPSPSCPPPPTANSGPHLRPSGDAGRLALPVSAHNALTGRTSLACLSGASSRAGPGQRSRPAGCC
jgi:hypothetical protein